VLQQIEEGHAHFARAAALVGEVFRRRGMHSLAVKKLEQALSGLDEECYETGRKSRSLF